MRTELSGSGSQEQPWRDPLPGCLAPEPMPFQAPFILRPRQPESLMLLELSPGSKPALLLQTQSSLLFSVLWSLCRPWLQHSWWPCSLSVFTAHWVLVTFTQVQTVPFVCPLAFLPSLGKKLYTNQKARKRSWPVEHYSVFMLKVWLVLRLYPPSTPAARTASHLPRVCIHSQITQGAQFLKKTLFLKTSHFG